MFDKFKTTNNEEKTDEELVFLSLKDSIYFGELIERYESKLRRYMRRISSFSPEENDDLIQDVFLKVYENLYSFEEGEKFSPWIYRITHNKVVDHWKKTKKHDFDISVDENLKFIESVFWDNNIDQKIIEEDNKKIVRELFSNLELKYKEIFILRYYEGKTYEEISDILRIPKSTVSTLLNRGKQKLLKEYRKIENKINN